MRYGAVGPSRRGAGCSRRHNGAEDGKQNHNITLHIFVHKKYNIQRNTSLKPHPTQGLGAAPPTSRRRRRCARRASSASASRSMSASAMSSCCIDSAAHILVMKVRGRRWACDAIEWLSHTGHVGLVNCFYYVSLPTCPDSHGISSCPLITKRSEILRIWMFRASLA